MPSSSSTASSLAAVILHLLLLTCAFRPLSSSSTLHHRRILHQPFLPQDSSPPSPPSPPPTPSPPKYPFTSSTPDNSPFFQSYPSPPSPPSPASLATFPANISSLSVPRPSKPHSASNKLIIAAVAAVIAAVAIVSLSVFLHLRKRNSTHGSSSFCESKTQRSDSCSTISYNQTPNTHHIPKLQRPSQTSSEFLYIGTLVNTHAPGGAAFNGSTTSTTIYSNAPNTRKLDSPELHPLPPLNIQQGLRQNFRNNAEVVSSKDDESEEFYSPKGSILGKESSIGTGTASRRAFAAIEVENFNGSSSNSSSTYSSSVPGSGSASPVRSLSSSLSPANNMSPINSIPKSPDLIEIQTTASVPARTGSPPLVTQASLLHESASPSPPSSSPERYSRRSDESSPRISNASGQDVESPAGSNSEIQQNTTVFPTPPEILGLMLPQSAPMLLPSSPSPERCLGRNEDLSPRNSDVSDQHVESPVRISSHAQNNSTVVSVAEAPEMKPFVFPESTSSLPPISSSPDRSMRSEESSPRNSNVCDQSVECPVSPARHDSTVNPTASEIQLSPISSTPERDLKSEESSPRNLNVLDQNMESPVTISSPAQHISNEIPISPEMQDLVSQESALPLLSPSGLSSPQRHSRENEELSPRISNASDHDVEPPVSSPVQQEMQDLVLLSPERKLRRSEESTPRVSDVSNENVASLVRMCSTELHKPSPPNSSSLPEPRISDVPDEKVAPPMSISSTELHKSPSPISSSLPAPRMSNVSDENVASLRISSPEMHKPPLPISSSLPEKYLNGSEESSSRIMNDSEQPIESPERNCSSEQHNATSIPTCLSPPVYVPPPPPPPPPPLSRAWPSPKTPIPMAKLPIVPPTLKNPLKPIAFESPTFISPIQLPSNDSPTVKNDEGKESPDKGTEYSSENAESPPKPKLKPLHWDKVRASSDREMVWDQLKCSSFELNEEMIETLFVVNTSKPNPKETTKWQVLPSPGQDNGDRVLDPKKAQNIAILLKALHVTVDEVCEGLLEGNADILGTELLESLLKMAPTKEEERKLKEYKDDSPIKLGPAERFLKAVVDVPHAFRRLEAMLYISNFESEVEYLKKSFTTLEAACEELRTSRMFLKLLEAVLKTGNRMNVGTNRGDAHAFKLDTLLKLVDVKGADGKTTLLHFVVQEIIRSEGARLSGEGPQEKNDDAKCRKLGLQVVSALSSELSNVKKAAVMDAEMLSTDVSKLSKGIADVREVIKLNEDDNTKFSDNIRSFIERAEEEICRTQAQESLALSLVKEITEYFHGNSALEEAHPFRIFTVVKDFLTVLDRVCKEVGLINERTIVSLAHKFPVPVNPMLQQVPVAFHNRQCTLSDDESLPFNA